MLGQITFGKPLGYLDHGYDHDQILSVNNKVMDYFAVVGMQPELDKFLDKNRIYRIGPPSFGAIVNLSLRYITSRYKGEDKHNMAMPDFLDRFIEAKMRHPDVVDNKRLLSYLLIQITAGADSVAVTLRSVFYLSLKHPPVWSRLQSEILAAPFTQQESMSLPATFSQARKIPYLEAVVREALRLYPVDCFPLERYVPTGGVNMPDGSFVPEGVAAGFNAYILHRNKEVWGLDADAFRPERWLRDEKNSETEEGYKRRLTEMNNCDLSFGDGNRKCIGINLGLMEVYKTVATLVAMYEFELADPEQEWKIHNSIFPRQSGVHMRMRRRAGLSIPGAWEVTE